MQKKKVKSGFQLRGSFNHHLDVNVCTFHIPMECLLGSCIEISTRNQRPKKDPLKLIPFSGSGFCAQLYWCARVTRSTASSLGPRLAIIKEASYQRSATFHKRSRSPTIFNLLNNTVAHLNSPH